MKNTLKILMITSIFLQGTAGFADQYYTLWIKAGDKGGYYLQTKYQVRCPNMITTVLQPSTWVKCTLNEYGVGGGSFAQLLLRNQISKKECTISLNKGARDTAYTFSSTCNGATFNKEKLYIYLP